MSQGRAFGQSLDQHDQAHHWPDGAGEGAIDGSPGLPESSEERPGKPEGGAEHPGHRAPQADAEGGDRLNRMPLEASEDASNAKEEVIHRGVSLKRKKGTRPAPAGDGISPGVEDRQVRAPDRITRPQADRLLLWKDVHEEDAFHPERGIPRSG